MHYDTLIVGSGLGGLSAGLTLAKKGQRVAVLEKHALPGGYATNFHRRGKNGVMYEFDVSLHGIGSLNKDEHLHRLFEQFNLFQHITPLRKKETATLVYEEAEIDIPDDFASYETLLISHFPHERDGIIRLFHYLKHLHENLHNEAERSSLLLYIDDLQSVSLDAFLQRYIDDQACREFFSFLWLYYGLPSAELSAFYYLIPWLSYHIGGTYYISGGSQALSNAFVAEIKKHGGDVFLREEVTSVESNHSTVTALHTKKGNRFTADSFIFNGDPLPLFSLIEHKNEETTQYVQELETLEVGTSLSQLYVALDCHPTEIGMTKSDYLTMNHTSMKNWEYSKCGNYNEVDIAVTNYNELDCHFVKEGGVLVVVIGDSMEQWPERKTADYKQKKENVTTILLQRLEALFPGLTEHVVWTELGTPRTMHRYTNNRQGAVYGWAQSVSQAGLNRLSHTTPLTNLFLAGSWTTPGGGFEGAILSGNECGNLILAHQNVQGSPPIIDADTFMNGMTARFHSPTSITKKVTYHFHFPDTDDYWLTVYHNTATLSKKEQKADVVIRCTYETWYRISTGALQGEEALRTNQLTVQGNLALFLRIRQWFTSSYSDEDKSFTPIAATKWIPITLLPWIVYWIVGNGLSEFTLGSFGAVYTLVVPFVKPFRDITLLELVTFFSFSLYSLHWFDTTPFFMNGLLVGSFLLSALFAHPMTMDYTKWMYPPFVVRGKLFLQKNIKITVMWGIVFMIQGIFLALLPTPFHLVSLSLLGLGGWLSKRWG